MNQKKDQRYTYCLEKLGELINHPFEIVHIEKNDLSEVHEYDFFFEEFAKYIKKIHEELEPDDVLLLNISSGTPAMKAALLVLNALGEYPFISIQVSTPEGKMNKHIHDGYDVEVLWECNEDNSTDAPNRCKEVACPELVRVKQEEQIKKLLCEYDYFAAYELAEQLPKERTKAYLGLIELAKYRENLFFNRVDDIIKRLSMLEEEEKICRPIKEQSRARTMFEYIVLIQRSRFWKQFLFLLTIITSFFQANLKRIVRLLIRFIWEAALDMHPKQLFMTCIAKKGLMLLQVFF